MSGRSPVGDTVVGTTGPDVMCGGSAIDRMNGNSGNDELRGQGNNDTLNGDTGNDLLLGGGGNDTLTGSTGTDNFNSAGGSGNDRLLARDGEIDGVVPSDGTCGSGTDSLDIDLADAAFIATINVLAFGASLFLGDCESVTVGAVNEGPNVKISRHSVGVGEDGRAAVQLRCPASLPAPCAGKLAISASKKKVGPRKAYSIDQGEKENVSARLSQRDRNKLSQRGRITVGATSVEQGQHGDKTTVQTIKLIAQG